MALVLPTGTKSPEEVDGADKAPASETTVVAVIIKETTQLLIFISRKNERGLHFQINNYRNLALSYSI